MQMLQDCDIFLEGFRAGAAQRLGLGHEQLLERFPQLIYVSISAFGQDGPYRDRPAHDLSIVGMSGMLWQRAGSALEAPYVGHADLVAGMFAAFGAVSALQQRQRTGRG
ncbi:MAG TPA: CoA transferase, partial [bacterium]|nr:CoA transferase [bacterium]